MTSQNPQDKANREESIPPLPPTPKMARVVSELSDPKPPVKETIRPDLSEDDRHIMEILGITPGEDVPPPPTPPPPTIVSVLRGPLNLPPLKERSERVPSENGGSKLAGLARSPITFLRRLIKLARRFLSRDASGTVGSK